MTEGWVAEEFDNWRDAGWSFRCSNGPARLEFVVSAVGENDWLVQVAPDAVPGRLGRAFGKHPSASPDAVFGLSRLVHRVLSKETQYHGFRWRWDGPPRSDSDQEPVPAP